MLLTRETLLEEDLLSEDFESDFERAYSRAQKEFTREVSKEKDIKYNGILTMTMLTIFLSKSFKPFFSF